MGRRLQWQRYWWCILVHQWVCIGWNFLCLACSKLRWPLGIIKYDSALRVILIGIEELTPSSAIKRFTIPSLATLSVQESWHQRALSSKWGNYSEDNELVNALKAIPFVPQWSGSQWLLGMQLGSWRCLASNLFNWQIVGLMSSLQGPNLPSYTVPLNAISWVDWLLSDLGLQEDLDKEGFMRVIGDREGWSRSRKQFWSQCSWTSSSRHERSSFV